MLKKLGLRCFENIISLMVFSYEKQKQNQRLRKYKRMRKKFQQNKE